MGFSFRAVWGVITKRWAYTWAGVLCFIAVALLAASCGVSWFSYNTYGFAQFSKINATATTPNLEYAMYYETYETFLSIDTKVTLHLPGGVAEKTHTCDYSESGGCENVAVTFYNELAVLINCTEIQPPDWNLSHYQENYSPMFAFTLIAILLIIALGILLQVICWTYDRINGKITLALFIVAVILNVMILISLLITWTIFFGHDGWVRASLGINSELCAGGQTYDKAGYGNILCTWDGNWVYNQYVSRYEPFYNFYWRQQNPSWGPDSAWICSTIAFGMIGFVFLLIVGWRPAFKL